MDKIVSAFAISTRSALIAGLVSVIPAHVAAQAVPTFTVGACVAVEGNSGVTACNFPVTIAPGASVPLALDFHTNSPGNLLAPAADASFEEPVVGNESQIFGAASMVGAWTVESGNVELKSWRQWQAAHLRQSLDLHGDQPGAITRNLATQPGLRYLVSFALAGNPHCATAVTSISGNFGDQALGSFTADSSGFTTTNMGWRYHSVEVTATSASSRLRFASTTPGGCGPAIDDISVTPAGAASSGIDYQPASRHAEDPVSIAVGMTSYTITVNVIGDTAVEPLEDFQLRVCLAGGTCQVAVGGIENDDTASTGGGTGDEPEFTAFPLPTPSDFPACPAGFYIVAIDDGGGAGLTPGIFGLQLILDAPGSQRLEGGLNFGGLLDGSQTAFAGFNIQNAANEPQRLNLTISGNPASSVAGTLPVRIRLIRQPSAGVDEVVYETTASISNATAFTHTLNLVPGFHVVTVAPDGAASIPGGAADGEVYVTAETQFVDRPGGGFFGGVVVGGYHAQPLFGGTSGFAAFCVGASHTSTARVLSAPTYGVTGARDLRLRLLDHARRILISAP